MNYVEMTLTSSQDEKGWFGCQWATWDLNRVYNRTSFGLRGCALILLIPGSILACWWMTN